MFETNKDGIPLEFIAKSDYPVWLEEQSSFVNNWIKSTDYKGAGTALLPDENGSLQKVVHVAEQLSDFFLAEDLPAKLPPGTYACEGDDDLLLRVAFSWGVGSYRFDRYKKKESKLPILSLPKVSIEQKARHLVEAVCLVRDLVNTPAADMMPEHLSEVVDGLASEFDAKANHVVGEDLLSQNFPMIHAVGRASVHAPRFIELKWGDSEHPKVSIVGKGVCFDSGGLDIKPSAGMRLMKKDMGGAAHAIGLARLIMAEKLPIQLQLLIPAAENAVSSNSFRPGDIIPTRSGLQVEIDNTDAEGRLVLCDAITYASESDPELIIDFATLTGACRVALGTELPGFFSNFHDLARLLTDAGEKNSDPVWQLPLHKPYRDMLNTEVADILNCAPSGFGGAITAALYLQEFVPSTIPWAHFDLMAWNNRKLPGRPVGGEAFGIRTVFDVLASKYGSNS